MFQSRRLWDEPQHSTRGVETPTEDGQFMQRSISVFNIYSPPRGSKLITSYDSEYSSDS